MADLLIVEDDDLIASSLARALRAAGHQVVVAGSLAEAEAHLPSAALVLCDLGLPDGDGLDLIARITDERPGVPVMALTARAEEADVVAGLTSYTLNYQTAEVRDGKAARDSLWGAVQLSHSF